MITYIQVAYDTYNSHVCLYCNIVFQTTIHIVYMVAHMEDIGYGLGTYFFIFEDGCQVLIIFWSQI
jgi:hypothetical protein